MNLGNGEYLMISNLELFPYIRKQCNKNGATNPCLMLQLNDLNTDWLHNSILFNQSCFF